MSRGDKAALLVSCLALGGCSAEVQQVKVRPIADPGEALRHGGDAVALARGQLMIGNVGLALEGFRQAQRDNPTNPAAVAGIADCYAAMGRFDLAQSNYEAALALAPRDPKLLFALASVFDHEGLTARALAARVEARMLAQPATSATPSVQAASPSRPIQAPASVTPTARPASALSAVQFAPMKPTAAPSESVQRVREVAQATPPGPHAAAAQPAPPPAKQADELPPVRIAMVAPAVSIHSESVAPSSAARTATALSALAQSAFAVLSEPAAPAKARVRPIAAPVAQAAPSVGSITVELPPARSAEHVQLRSSPLTAPQVRYDLAALSSSITVPLPPARPAAPAKPAPAPIAPVAVKEASAPRLERLTLGEVALVTTGKPIWNTPRNSDIASSNGVRWAALAPAGGRPNIQILNAARSQGLAASARTVLVGRGWRRIDVGDAPAAEHKSVVLYSKNRATLGRRLAAQFGVAARMVERDILVLVLGRDAVDKVSGPRKS